MGVAKGGGPKSWGRRSPVPLGWGVADPIDMLVHHLCHHVKFGHSRSNDTSVIMEIRQKMLTLALRLSRYVTQGHSSRHGSISYLRLSFGDP